MKELSKTYDPTEIEARIYKNWEEKHYFHAKVDPNKRAFCIVMPPPNITGQLHMGHALDNTLQDILTRFKRMQGYEALWQPGTDHAAIATEVKIIENLKSQGISKEELGREGFLKKAWEWKDEYATRIITQLKKMGSSADWERERFTMDEGCSEAVEEFFVRLYEKGYIYRGNRIVNYCPVCHTSISDAEVEYQEQKGNMWHIKYPYADGSGYIEIATTRPETMLGDTAVCVHPQDERYQDKIGKELILPIVGRRIKVVADEYVDREFGTGAVKITPAHDPNDFEVGIRCGLEVINILNEDATINENGGKYCGLDRYEARKRIVEELKELGLLVEIEEHLHNVGTHDRCKTTVEPMVMPQWFVAMEELAKPAIEAAEKGELSFVPDRFKKTYLNWLYNIRDWCISRQLWWGHRIPAYTCKDCGDIVVAKSGSAPKKCKLCQGEMLQDEDTLDTWFSSALWPFSTLGWPKDTPELRYFYPTDVLVTAYDIIFFWVIRMVFSAAFNTDKIPFSHVFIHGLVRDDQGRKMSKSLGNGIDPLEVIDKYGADALRLTLVTGNAPGNDMRFYWERVEASRNFANKVWNASRFILMNINEEAYQPEEEDFEVEDRWIISRMNSVVAEVTENMEKYEFGIAVEKIYNFIWEEFCDWYIEIVKPRIYNAKTPQSANCALWTLSNVLSAALKLLHPYMPFITEEIYLAIHPQEDTIMTKEWPVFDTQKDDPESVNILSEIIDMVRAIRNLRGEMNVPVGKRANIYISCDEKRTREIFENNKNIYKGLVFADEVSVTDKEISLDNAISVVIRGGVVYIPLNELVDMEKEKARLEKEKERLLGELKRSQSMLTNERFLSKAPAEKVEDEQQKKVQYEKMLEDVKARLDAMK